MRKVLSKINLWFDHLICCHDYRLTDPDEYFPLPEEVGADCVSYIREHTCKYCKKTKLIGSGMIY